jgi:transposase
MDLTNEQWSVLEPLTGKLPKRADGRGATGAAAGRHGSGILWILRTGAQWADLPEQRLPSSPPRLTPASSASSSVG